MTVSDVVCLESIMSALPVPCSHLQCFRKSGVLSRTKLSAKKGRGGGGGRIVSPLFQSCFLKRYNRATIEYDRG